MRFGSLTLRIFTPKNPGLRLTTFLLAAVAVGLLGQSFAPARAQNPDTLMPEQSTARAKQILQETVDALGGAAYLDARDREATARLSSFMHSGDLGGFTVVHDLWRYPDKHRTEYYKKENVIDVYNGKQAWTMDRAGVHDLPEDAGVEFQESLRRSLDFLLRYRMKEEGLTFRYAGNEIVDLRPVVFVDVTDKAQRTMRIAIDRMTHLPVRSTVSWRDPATHDHMDETTVFSNWHAINGVQIPFQTTRERNGRKFYQLFLDECKYNSGLADALFTRESLEARWKQIGKK